MNDKPKTFVILTPGFAKDEADSTCIPTQQNFVRALKEIYPQLNIITIYLKLFLCVQCLYMCLCYACLWLDHPFVCKVRSFSIGKCIASLELDRTGLGYRTLDTE